MSTLTQISETEFLNREIAVWGEDYVFDLIDRGYELIPLTDSKTGSVKWAWIMPCGSR